MLLSLSARAADWPQWRGPNRDNVWNETGILRTFPNKGLKFRWRTPVGPGWTSPVVVQGGVYLTDMRLDKPKAWERIRAAVASLGLLSILLAAKISCEEVLDGILGQYNGGADSHHASHHDRGAAAGD